MEDKRGFFEKWSYVLFPKEDKGTTALERMVSTFFLKGTDAWQARLEVPEEKRLLDAMTQLSDKMGIPAPKKLLIYDSIYPNAAKLGNGTVMVGNDLMRILTHDQMDAVIGHELSHQKHSGKDFMITNMLGIPAFLAGYALTRGYTSQRMGMSKWPSRITAFVVGNQAAQLVELPYRRHMEYQADQDGAMLTTPEAMEGALEALKKRSNEIRMEKNQKTHGNDAPVHTDQIPLSLPEQVARAQDPHPAHKDRVAAMQRMSYRERALQSDEPNHHQTL